MLPSRTLLLPILCVIVCICESQTPNPFFPIPSPLETTSLFSVSASLFHSYLHLCHILNSTYKQHPMTLVFFWLALLRVIISRSMHVTASGISSSIFMTDWYSITHALYPSYIYHVLSIHPSANGHWGCFHVLVFVNSAAVLYVSFWIIVLCGASPVAQMVQTSTCNVGDPSLIPGLRRSPGWGHGSPFQYSCLENPHGEKSLVGYSPWGHRVGHGWATKQTHTQGWDSWIIW